MVNMCTANTQSTTIQFDAVIIARTLHSNKISNSIKSLNIVLGINFSTYESS